MNLKAVLEGLLFVAGDEGLSTNQIIDTMEINEDIFNGLVKDLENDYNSEDRGIKLEYLGGKLKLVTKKEHAFYYKSLFSSEESNTLSPSALETLAIIAYNEPVTRVFVDEIRGVSSVHIIRKLLFMNFIKEVGRSELPGRPILYGVTNDFLDYFGLSSTKELPKVEVNDDDLETDLFDSKFKEVDNV